MNTFLRNTISKLYNAVAALVTATRDALAERLQSVMMIENMGYGRERLKDSVEKEAEEEQQHEEDWRKDPWFLKLIPDRFKTQ